MDDHQRDMWRQMLGRVASYEQGEMELGTLIAELRGLFVEADPHDQSVRSDFDRW